MRICRRGAGRPLMPSWTGCISDLRSLGLTKVSRLVLADGDFYQVQCAVLRDGVSAPAADLLAQLEKGVWRDPAVDRFPDEYQPTVRRRLLAEVEYLAENGELEGQFNRLRMGIWELKIGNLRVTFYDTPGDGTFSPKFGEPYWEWDGSQSWILPDFDEFVRLGHCFAKDSQKTREIDIQHSIRVREEDISHDR